MKLIFLVALVYLAAEWPTPSVCWPMGHQFGSMDSSPLSSIIGQQMLSNQMNGYGMNTLTNGLGSRFNPDLMKAFGNTANNNEQRTAFSRAGNHAKSKKLSNTKFMLKPTATVEVEEPLEETIEKFEQELEIEKPTPAVVVEHKQKTQELKTTEKVVKPQHEEQPTKQATAKVEAKVEESRQQVKQKVETVASTKPVETPAAAAPVAPAKEAVVEEVLQNAQQQVEEVQEQQHEQTSNVEKQTSSESVSANEHPAVKALQEATDSIQEFQMPGHAAYVEPFQTQQSSGESVRMLNGRQPAARMHNQHQNRMQHHQQQQQQQQAYDQFFTNEFMPQQKQQAAAAANNLNNKQQLRFKMTKPDMVHNVGIDTITDEMSRVLSSRKEDQSNSTGNQEYAQTQRPSGYNSFYPQYGRTFGGNAAYTPNTSSYTPNTPNYVPNTPSASTYMPNTDGLAQAFSSLIIIVNSNANSNLGVTLIDVDLFRSFLSQFAAKSVDDVLKDSSLETKISDFNKERERTLSATSNGKEKNKKNESVSKLSANVPSYSSDPAKVDPIDSHSESTVLLNRKGSYTSGYASNPYTYSYVPYQSGGLIVVNNVNDNYNKVVKSVLSGKGTNIGKNDAFVLPLPPNEITRLMEDAVIVNNDNKNTNIN